MPRIVSKNERFRTKDELCEDIAFVLNSPLKYGTKFAVLSEATWVWTEYEGKYKGCLLWSEEALKVKSDLKKLVHEHVVPKSVVMKKLRDLKKTAEDKVTAESVREVMDFYCIGAVVTRDEDKRLNKAKLRSKMPDGCAENDVRARYTAVGIVLREMPAN